MISVLMEDTEQGTTSYEFRHYGKLTGILEAGSKHLYHIRTI